MNTDLFLITPILFPVLAGLIAALFGKTGISDKAAQIFITAFLAVETVLVFACLGGDRALYVGQINKDLVVFFEVDTLSSVFAGLVVSVWLLVGIYSFGYLEEDSFKCRFFCFYLMSEGMLVALSFAGNIFTFYMFFEMMTVLSFPLVMHDGTKEAIMAGLKYMFYSIAGAFMMLFGLFMLTPYGVLGEFKPGGILDIAGIADRKEILLVSALCMIIGLGTKAGMFPMHSWLPTAHPVAPAPASAVLSGVITKAGVIGVIRVVYYCTGPRILAGTYVQNVWIVLALFTVLMGSMMAYREKVLKKRLAYSTVSQVSYIMFGLAVMNSAAFTGAVLHIVFHSLIKTMLFLMSGAVIHKTGCKNVDELTAVGRKLPVTMWCYTIVSLGLIGIPPLSGFVSKWYLASGALMSGSKPYSWAGPVILLISALLTAGYLLPVAIKGYMPGADTEMKEIKAEEVSPLMYIPMIVLTAGTVILGIYPPVLTDIVRLISGPVF